MLEVVGIVAGLELIVGLAFYFLWRGAKSDVRKFQEDLVTVRNTNTDNVRQFEAWKAEGAKERRRTDRLLSYYKSEIAALRDLLGSCLDTDVIRERLDRVLRSHPNESASPTPGARKLPEG